MGTLFDAVVGSSSIYIKTGSRTFLVAFQPFIRHDPELDYFFEDSVAGVQAAIGKAIVRNISIGRRVSIV
jgi:hypothetical protein